MDQETVVSDKKEDGWKLVVQFDRDGGGVAAAFWIKTGEDSQWSLCIASTLADQDPLTAYRTAFASLAKLPNNSVAKSELKIISPASPLAQRLLRIQPRHPLLAPQRIGGVQIGPLSVQAGLIYPAIPHGGAAMTHDEVKRTLFDLLNRRGLVQPSTITLQDGSTFRGVPFGIEVSSNLMNAKFIDDASPLPRIVLVDDIASIQ